MAGKKRTSVQREFDLQEIARMYLVGTPQYRIAEILSDDPNRDYSLSQQQISYDLKLLNKRWQESSLVDMNEAKSRELAKIDNLEREYWEAWERSKLEKQVSTAEKGSRDLSGEPALGFSKAVMKKEEQLGDPRFLSGIQWCIEQRCKLLGVNAPLKFSSTSPDGKTHVPTGVMIVQMPDNGRSRDNVDSDN